MHWQGLNRIIKLQYYTVNIVILLLVGHYRTFFVFHQRTRTDNSSQTEMFTVDPSSTHAAQPQSVHLRLSVHRDAANV